MFFIIYTYIPVMIDCLSFTSNDWFQFDQYPGIVSLRAKWYDIQK